jgi:DNA-binding transcriptional ArsR family regulator
MTPSRTADVDASDVFKALGDPIRWSIVQQMAEVEELACSTLEDTLPISKPTISYHTKILTQAGLITVRKQGRNFFYTLRRDVLRDLMDDVWSLAPEPRPVVHGRVDHQPSQSRRRRPVPRPVAATRLKAAVGDEGSEAALLTW